MWTRYLQYTISNSPASSDRSRRPLIEDGRLSCGAETTDGLRCGRALPTERPIHLATDRHWYGLCGPDSSYSGGLVVRPCEVASWGRRTSNSQHRLPPSAAQQPAHGKGLSHVIQHRWEGEPRVHRVLIRGLRRGTPVMLIHGFPLNGAAWEKRVAAAQDAQDTRPTL